MRRVGSGTGDTGDTLESFTTKGRAVRPSSVAPYRRCGKEEERERAKKQNILLYSLRFASARDIWTGFTLEGDDARAWHNLEQGGRERGQMTDREAELFLG